MFPFFNLYFLLLFVFSFFNLCFLFCFCLTLLGHRNLELDHGYKIIVSRIFNYRIDVKFPCFKLTLTPVWSVHYPINQLSPISHLFF